ncbi:hypothetical protein NIES4071_35720 [Calothrix sp. NIES-4071]|nr:hypothetical protein NIES4071_35720 [Calothrix sp. NIES-4071]BAZ57891.1 hypothetical protein NIES4105_35650 [Calothrix sp. NIES-4105]
MPISLDMQYRFPFPAFSNGWFCVAYSNELPLKKVIPLRYFGKDLVLIALPIQ